MCTICNDRTICSIGTKRWDGTPIYIGYENRIGNKDFEVDHEISRAEMPTITGAEDFDEDIELVASQAESPLFIEAKKRKTEIIDVDAAVVSSNSSTPAPVNTASSAGKKYVPPASFYAPAQPKKAKGPLYVSNPSINA